MKAIAILDIDDLNIRRAMAAAAKENGLPVPINVTDDEIGDFVEAELGRTEQSGFSATSVDIHMLNRIQQVIDLYVEHRSDVAAILMDVLNGDPVTESEREARFVTYTHGGIQYEYDTLTTHVSFLDARDDKWKLIEGIKYHD